MRVFIIAIIYCLSFLGAQTQGVTIHPGLHFKTSGGIMIVSNNASILNNGSGDFSGANLLFTGAGTIKIGGTNPIAMKDLSINKTGGSLLLQSPVSVSGQVNLV